MEMKITILSVLLSVTNIFASNTYSQTAKVTLNAENKTLEQVMDEIEQQSEFYFIFNQKQINVNRTVNVQVDNKLIDEILPELFAGTDVNYSVLDRKILLTTDPIKDVPHDVKTIFNAQQVAVSGTIIDAATKAPMPGVNVVVKGTTIGTLTDANGKYSLPLTDTKNATLVFSFIGYGTKEIQVAGRSVVDGSLTAEITGLDEVVVIGYGTQRKSDITGTVASLSEDRLAEIPQVNVAQAVQGSIPGVMIQTTSAGAASSEVILIRGRNSITASNNPLIVVDGIPYGGNLMDINTNDVKSIEVLKDASAVAIYGSRGSNGVILITTKTGIIGAPRLLYDGYVSIQGYYNLPDIMDGAEFYNYKMQLVPELMSQEETEIYEAGTWEDWYDIVTRTGITQHHNLSVSGATQSTKYYISGALLDVRGLTLNDDLLRVTSRINVDTELNSWLTIGTRTQFSYNDQSGESPSWSQAFSMNPLTRAYDENGNINVYPWKNNPYYGNPLAGLLYDNIDESYQILTNNYAIIKFPFIEGLNYRINTGFRFRFSDEATYRGRNTKQGLELGGSSDANRERFNNSVIENILTYNREFNKHTIFATAVYSFEHDKSSSHSLHAEKYPNDFLSWYASAQAELRSPSYSYNETALISQMLRLNYTYDKRYLLTLTGRRDGYSGFGSLKKWGIFPSLALGWNFANETFFPFSELFNEFKFRLSYGLNGNQAVGAYRTITRLSEYNMVDAKVTIPGYWPSVFGDENLGWESSKTLNFGLDFGILNNRFSGNLNAYKTLTSDLLLNRAISPVHGLTSITQNIGKVENTGLEISFNSRNISSSRFEWSTSVNMAFVKNRIISLYGELDEAGNEIDDLANNWFIGHPVRVNYGFVRIGVWQLNEAEEAAKWGSQPGYIKIKDVNGDYILDVNDMEIIGQQDPKFLWGMTNSFSYDNLKLNLFIHGVHGVTLHNNLMAGGGTAEIRDNVMNKDFWTPENPTNVYQSVDYYSNKMGGVTASYYQNASFIRIKDISISYDLPTNLKNRIGFDMLRVYITGRNLFTFTEWTALDPEISNQKSTPLQRELIFGLNFRF